MIYYKDILDTSTMHFYEQILTCFGLFYFLGLGIFEIIVLFLYEVNLTQTELCAFLFIILKICINFWLVLKCVFKFINHKTPMNGTE